MLGRVPAGRRGPRKPCRSCRDPFCEEVSAGLGRQPDGRQASSPPPPGRPPQQVAPLVSPCARGRAWALFLCLVMRDGGVTGSGGGNLPGPRGGQQPTPTVLLVPEVVAGRGRGTAHRIKRRPSGFGGCPRAATSSGKETAGARRRERCWPLTVRSCSALERTLDRMQCDQQPAHMCLHNLQRQVASHPHAWIS